MRRALGLVVVTFLFHAGGALAAQIQAEELVLDAALGGEAALTVLETGAGTLTLEFTLPRLASEELVAGGETYQALAIPGGGLQGLAGRAGLPTFSRLVALPPGATASVRVVAAEERELTGFRVFPVQPADAADFVIDRDWYAGRGERSEDISAVALGEPASLGGLSVAPLTVSPVAWDPATGMLRAASRLVIELDLGDVDLRDAMPAQAILPESFDRLYRDTVLGWERSDDSAVGPGAYLLICRDNSGVLSRLEPLLEWRRRQGYDVILATTTQTGTTTGSIKNYIQGIYDTADPPLEFIALAGDATGSYSIPCWNEGISGYGGEGDHYYTTLDGGDILSDAHIGRLSFQTYTELETIVDKIVTYETAPPLSDTGWFTRAGLAGDPSSSGITTIYVNQWVKQHLLAHNYTQVDTLWYPSASQMTASINQGLTVFGYRGWLNMSGMSSGYISSLNNGYELPFAVIVTCATGSFQSDGNCRSEAFLRAPNGGGIGAVGTATTGTHTRYNNCYYNGAWEGAINGTDHRLGFAHTRGKLEIYANYQLSQPNTVEIWSVWNNLMGDPATRMRMAYPADLSVVHPAQLPVGANSLLVSVSTGGSPVADALVAVYKSGELRVTGYTDAAGDINLPIAGYSAGELLVTVLKNDHLPYLGGIDLGSVPVFAAYEASTIDDDDAGGSSGNGNARINPGETIELPVALRNHGTNPAAGVTATIASADPYLTISDSAESFGDIPAGATVWSTEDYDFTVAADAPDGHVLAFDLEAQGGLETWVSLIELTVTSAAFQQESFTWSGGGSTLDPGESGAFSVSIRNVGSIAAAGVSALLRCEDNWVTVTDSLGVYGDIGIGAASENTGDTFTLDISADCFQGHLAFFTLRLEFGEGYVAVAEFGLPVGTASSDDPIGPDAYGYYAFDNTDTGYPFTPSYNWIEIDPNHGGPGTSVGLTDYGWEQDDTQVLDLPFTFYYYGEPYGRISVCSNGWVAMGSSSLTHYRNWNIPGTGGPDAMIAPFWDNLYQQSTNLVYYWDDEENARFVVQWSRVKNDWSGATQNFELVLFDPAVYHTVTGDGQILFQYDTVGNTDTQNGYATVGIQNRERTDGVLYTYWNQYAQGAATLASGRAILFMPVGILNLGQLEGSVLNATAGGTPAPGVEIRVMEAGQTLISQAGGDYSGAVQEGTYTVRAQHESFLTEEVAGVGIVEDETTELNFLLSDILGPYIENTTVLPHTEDTVGPYVVDTWITDFSAVDDRRFHYSTDDGIVELPLVLVDSETGQYRAEIPGQESGTQVRYWLSARDEGGNWSRVPAGMDTFSFWITTGVLVAEHDMESEQGWTAGDTGDTAISGLWERADPVGVWEGSDEVQPEDDASAVGTMCFITGNAETGQQGVDDVDDGKTTLLSPWFDLSEAMGVTASYRRWYTNDTGYNPSEDYWVVEATGDGVTWVSLEYTNVSDRSWALKSFILDDYIELTSTVRLRFIASDFGGGSLVEAGVDEFVLSGFGLPDATGEPEIGVPARLTLLPASPNPFNPVTHLRFGLPEDGTASLRIYDVAGRVVRALLVDEPLAAGYHDIVWDGRDDLGRPASSGVYLYRVSTDMGQLSAKATLLK